MEIEDQINELLGNIQTWLKTGPSDADIRAYLKQLPEDYHPAVEYADVMSLDMFFEGIRDYWTSIGWNVAGVMTPIDQIEMIGSLRTYNLDSVVASYAKRFPQAVFAATQAPVLQWADERQKVWRSINAVDTELTFVKGLPLYRTMLKLKKERGDVSAVITAINSLVDEDARMAEAGHLPEKSELEGQVAKLKGMAVFPDEYIGKLVDPIYYEEKALVLSSFALAGEVITALGDQNLENQEAYEGTLWDYLYDRSVIDSLEYLEKRYHVRPQKERDVLRWLVTNWNPSAIENDTFATAANAYIAPMDPGERQLFNRLFMMHVAASPVTQVMLDPLNTKHLVERFKRTKGNVLLMRNILLDAVKDILDENDRTVAVKTCEYIFQFM